MEQILQSNNENKCEKVGILYMLCGLPGAGKTQFASTIEGAEIFSSDAVRKEMFGDEKKQGSAEEKEKLFVELHKRIKNTLSKGGTAVYDATNLNKKRRIAFLKELKNITCYKQCILMATPYDVCLENNKKRNRVVPEEIIKRMYMNFQPPHESEGWDEIVVRYYFNYDYYVFLEQKESEINGFDQKNDHHSLTLDQHLLFTCDYLADKDPEDGLLCIAGALHDIGKVFTQSKLNKKGEDDGNFHYYQHHCVSAYDSLFHSFFNYGDYVNTSHNILDIANLIFYHMHPYLSWAQSEKAMEKDKELLGEKFFKRVMLLHEADKAAH